MYIPNFPLKKIKYSGDKSKISMPMGGIGTGCIGLSKNGRLNAFKVFGKTSAECYGEAFFAVKAEIGGKISDIKELKTCCACEKNNNCFGGVFSCFEESDFLSSYPFGETDFFHERFPGKVHLTAWNPLIPFNDIDSGIPAAFLEYEIENSSEFAVDYTFYGILRSPFIESTNTFCNTRNPNIKCVKLVCDDEKLCEYEKGEMCIGVYGDNIKYLEYLNGKDASELGKALLDIIEYGELENTNCKNCIARQNISVISSKINLEPGGKEKVRFVISWYMPYCRDFLNENEDSSISIQNESCSGNYRKNYYTRYFDSSDECIYYCLSQWERLYEETNLFRELLFTSTLPTEVLDAASSNISVLKTPTCQRYSDGTFLGFDGCGFDSVIGDAMNSKTWNYAYALSYLFPSLERAVLADHFEYDMNTTGALDGKSNFPNEIADAEVFPDAEAQFGDVLKVYRTFRLCGNTEWLASVWKQVVKAVEYAQSTKNPLKWDVDENGIISEFRNGETFCRLGESAFYLAALAVVSELSKVLKDKKHAEKFSSLYKNGKSILNDNLCRYNFDTEKDEKTLRQILTAQWHCNINGIGEIIYSEIIKRFLRNVYNDYSADFDKYSKLYCGMEYVLSYLMINNGMTSEALEMVRRTRLIYDGSENNPFGEKAIGMNSAVSLSGYTLLGAVCDMQIDNYNKYIKYCPDMRFAEKNVFVSIVCFENFLGFAERGIDYIQLKCLKGSTLVRKIEVPDIPLKVKCGGIEIGFEKNGNCAVLDNDCEVNTERDMLVIFRI